MPPEPRPAPGPSADVLPLFAAWELILGDLLDRTARFPKAVRFTFASRIDHLGLGILEGLVEARYARGARKVAALERIDLDLAKLRVLLRLAFERQYLDRRGFEHVALKLDEAGRMLGGWLKQQR